MKLTEFDYQKAATLDQPVLLDLLASSEAGLDKVEHDRRLVECGPNEVRGKETTARDILLRQLKSPFLFLLAAAAVIAFWSGEPVDATLIIIFILINTGLGFFQEYRAERSSKLLSRYWTHKVHAVRGGETVLVDARDLVIGDIVHLQAGDRLPADVRFIASRDLTVDESVLTGESVHVAKTAAEMEKEPTGWFEASNIGFSGTAVLTGEARGVVYAAGRGTALGDITRLASRQRPPSSFERSITNFSYFVLKLIAATLTIIFALNLSFKGMGQFGDLLLFTIALTVGVVPEALPLVTTLALSTGAIRMAREKVVVKRLAAISDLGGIDVLCTDKTGTMTENALCMVDTRSDDPAACLELALLASSFVGERERQANNAFDLAFWEAAPAEARARAGSARRIGELPFDPVRRRNSVLLAADGGTLLVTRGSPDDILPLCLGVREAGAIAAYLEEQGRSGNRVIAVARKTGVSPEAELVEAERGLEFVGLIALNDPVKRGAAAACRHARSLGVQVKILTGDAKAVAGAVAAELGIIDDPADVMTGAELERMPAEAQIEAVRRCHVFARVDPEQKFSILALLKQNATVGFLGEGFNDAPGLKLADVGIAVEGASDVSKEAADVILLNKHLSVILDGIAEGRRTFMNVIKYIKITMASNFGNFYAVAVASLFIEFLPMLPVQILLLNLLSDFPMIAIAADSVDRKELRKPAHYNARDVIFIATILGIVSSLFDFATFAVFRGYGEGVLQTLWFTESVLTEIVLIYSLRTTRPFWRGARPPGSILFFTAAAVLAVLILPQTGFGHAFFHFVPPAAWQLAAVVGIVAAYFVVSESVKLWMARHHNGHYGNVSAPAIHKS